jgi:hypothetical protein
MIMITIKKWYQSKILWAAIVTILLGVVPLVLEFIKAVAPSSLTTAAAVFTLISGVLTLIWRVFFTNQPIG